MSLLFGPRRALLGLKKTIYLIRDEFTDTRAAGSVDGTAATPGPGTRDVVDTGNLLSVSGGDLVQAAGGGGSDPRLSYDETFDRIVGRFIKTKFQGADIIVWKFGWDLTPTGIPDRSDIRAQGGGIVIDDAGTGISVAPPLSNSTTYEVAIILKSTGAYYFVKGGVYTAWTLLFAANNDNTDPVYVGLVGQNAEFDTDYIRVPQDTYLPAPLCYDTFTRADGAPGNTETTGPDGQTCTARAWLGNGSIDTNELKTTAGGTAGVDVLTEEQFPYASITCTAGEEAHLRSRLDDATSPADYLDVYMDRVANTIKVDEVVGGVPSNKSSTAFTYSATANLTYRLIGTSYYVFYNNILVTNGTTTVAGGTQVGVSATDTASRFNDFGVFESTGSQYDVLDTY